jgi:hypothetical protein
MANVRQISLLRVCGQCRQVCRRYLLNYGDQVAVAVAAVLVLIAYLAPAAVVVVILQLLFQLRQGVLIRCVPVLVAAMDAAPLLAQPELPPTCLAIILVHFYARQEERLGVQ